MKYSIIIPLYNVANYVVRCLESIVNQKPADSEVILIDDGSTDGTVETVKSCINAYKGQNINLLTKKNGGVSSARNLGISKATGQYLIFVDSDDILYDSFFSEIKKIEEYDYDLTVFGYDKNYGNGNVIKSWTSKCENFSICDENALALIAEYIKKTNTQISWYPWGKIFKKDIVDLYHIKFDESLICCNDFNFFFKYFSKCRNVSFINSSVVLYSVTRDGSITKSRKFNNIKTDCRSYYSIFKLINSMDGSNESKNIITAFIFKHYFANLKTCGGLTSEESKEIEKILVEQKELYYFDTNFKVKFERFIYKLLGINKGARIFLKLRKFKNDGFITIFRKNN